jgi:hypothetical protein
MDGFLHRPASALEDQHLEATWRFGFQNLGFKPDIKNLRTPTEPVKVEQQPRTQKWDLRGIKLL